MIVVSLLSKACCRVGPGVASYLLAVRKLEWRTPLESAAAAAGGGACLQSSLQQRRDEDENDREKY